MARPGLEGAADCKGMAQARERPTPTQGGIGAQTFFSRRQGPRPAASLGVIVLGAPALAGCRPPTRTGRLGSPPKTLSLRSSLAFARTST